MIAKKVTSVVIALAVVAAFGGCAGKRGPLDPTPGGPIIVIEPTPDPEGYTDAMAQVYDYTGWYAGCPEEDEYPPKAERTSTYKGMPWRFGDELGAEKIVVTLKPGHKSYTFDFNADGNSFKATTIELGFPSPPSLTIKLEKSGAIPTWTLEGELDPLTFKWIVPMHNLSRYLYGHMTKLTITDESAHTEVVDLVDLQDIRISYYKDAALSADKCE